MYDPVSTCMRTCKHQNVGGDECKIFLLGRCASVWCRVQVNACDQFQVVWVSVICVFVYLSAYVFFLFPYKSPLLKMYIHPSYGGKNDTGPHTDGTWGFSSGPIKTCLISALKINSSRGTGGHCTTYSRRQKQMIGWDTATLGRGSSGGKLPPSVLLEGGMILVRQRWIHAQQIELKVRWEDDMTQCWTKNKLSSLKKWIL